MPRITHAQQQELEQQQNQAVEDRKKIAEQHIVDIQKIEAQVKVVAAEHDAVVQQYKNRIAEEVELQNVLRADLETERHSRESLEEELAQEKAANASLVQELREYRKRAEASLNYITASLLALFGTAVAALAVSRCQEPEL